MVNSKSNSLILELENVSKTFGPLEILKNVNLSLNSGESLAILGPSGSGKSTLLHIAGLMDLPTNGSVRLKRKETKGLNDNDLAQFRLDSIGFLFQFHYLLPDFNVLENVLMPSRLAEDDLAHAELEALKLLKRLGLQERLNHKPYELSGGEQQRTALARALIRKPQILLCDEPTGNLDQDTAENVASLIWSETRNNCIGTIVVTHNTSLAQKADRSIFLIGGNLNEKRS